MSAVATPGVTNALTDDPAICGVMAADAVLAATGAAIPVTAASATSPDTKILRTSHLFLGIPN
jgi:hypothetical protein